MIDSSQKFSNHRGIRDIYYVRCSIPSDALDYKPRLLLFLDAADIGIVIGVYACYERPGNIWSCDLLFGKGFYLVMKTGPFL